MPPPVVLKRVSAVVFTVTLLPQTDFTVRPLSVTAVTVPTVVFLGFICIMPPPWPGPPPCMTTCWAEAQKSAVARKLAAKNFFIRVNSLKEDGLRYGLRPAKVYFEG